MSERKMNEADFQEIEKIGQGAYGVVYTALDKITNEVVAIKKISLEQSWLPLLQEINMVVDLAHPTIVNYKGWFFVGQELWLVMEYCDGGSLSDIMRTLNRPLTEKEVAAVCVGILESLIYIHSLNRIHRDIKSGNVLVTSNGQVKLCDFGVSAQLDDSLAKTGTRIGSPYWMAPEVISADPTGHNTKADIWSFGITALELISGNPPLSDLQPFLAMLKIPSSDPPAAPQNSSQDFKNFIKKTLVKDQEKRPTAKDLMNEPFIQKAKGQAREIVCNLVQDFIEKRSQKKTTIIHNEEVEEEEEDMDDIEAREQSLSSFISSGGTFTNNGSGTFIQTGDGTMVVNDSVSKKSSGLSGWQMKFTDTPAEPKGKIQKKRPFRNFKTEDLKSMLKRLKEIAIKELEKRGVSPEGIRANYESCRIDIVKELQTRKDQAEIITDEYEKLL